MHAPHFSLAPLTFTSLVQSPPYATLSFMQGYLAYPGLEVKPRPDADSDGDSSALSVASSQTEVANETSLAPSPYRNPLGQLWMANIRRRALYHVLKMRKVRDVRGHMGATMLIDPLDRITCEVKSYHDANRRIDSERFSIISITRRRMVLKQQYLIERVLWGAGTSFK
jgi:hypothetical protein